MPWGILKDQTLPALKDASLEERKAFSKVANAALLKGESEKDAIVDGLAAAKNTSCSYQIQGEIIDVPLTNAEMQQLYAWVSELVTKSATKEEIATAVWSKPTSELTVENSIGKWLMQKVLTVSKFLALK